MITFYADDKPHYYLSNFYPYPLKNKNKTWKGLSIQYEGQSWPTSEHLYQALKFLNETKDEKEWRECIRNATTPFISKYLGHQNTHTQYSWQGKYKEWVLHYKDKVRHAIDVSNPLEKQKIMITACRAKFAIPELMQQLKSTGNSTLGEDSNDEWGFRGANLLGNVLVQIRDE